MKALCLPAIGFGNWDQMEKKQRALGLVMARLEALTGATRNTVVPAPQPPLPEAAAGTEVMREAEIGTGTKTGTETETKKKTEIETETGIETKTGSETETGSETGSGSETERALSAGQTRSQSGGPLGRGTHCTCMERT